MRGRTVGHLLGVLVLCGAACETTRNRPAAVGGMASSAGSAGEPSAAGAGVPWPNAGCTFGQNQTCNENLAMSAYSGTCSSRGTCTCFRGFAVKLETGKCDQYKPQPDAPCERNPSCNDDTSSSTQAGICLTDGSCHCLGTSVKNPQTGLCTAR